MLRVDLRYAKTGMQLALPVRHPRARKQVLLKLGYELEPSSIERLRELGVRFIWVRCPVLQLAKGYINEEIHLAQNDMMDQIADAFNAVQRQSVARMSFSSYVRSMSTMVSKLVENPQAATFMGDLDDLEDDYLRQHSTNTTYLSVLMGLKLEGYLIKQRKHIESTRAKEVINLGLGAMLHDIGVLHLEPEVRQRYEQTGDESDPAWREHPTLGYQLVRGSVEPSAATVVLNHHQRFDGSGYAGSEVRVLNGERIHIFARIVGLAESLDRLRRPRNQPPRPTVLALRALLDPRLAQRFDPQVLRALLMVVPPYPPGSIVTLSDSRYAVVVDHSPVDPCRPTVQVIPHPDALEDLNDDSLGPMIDLSEEDKGLCVAQMDGQDVSRYNFVSPEIMRDEMLAFAAM